MSKLPDNFNAKKLRAEVLRCALEHNGKLPEVVCYTCGNAAKALREVGFDVLEVGGNGPLTPNGWHGAEFIYNAWPNRFDATSGHLSAYYMQLIAQRFRATLGKIDGEYIVPTGSGETLVCLKMAYPKVNFIAAYDNSSAATQYNAQAPLNNLVSLLASAISCPQNLEWR